MSRRTLLVAALLFCQLFFNACAAGKFMDHSFSFDAFHESPEVEVLDYQYGDKGDYEKSGAVGLRPAKYRLERGDVFQAGGVGGVIPKGDYLYVKWRIKGTGEVYEDRVELTRRLPKDITFYALHFVIQGSQLYVYLIPPDPAKPGDSKYITSTIRPSSWNSLAYSKRFSAPGYAEYFKNHQIYPN
jgi:hypothetical protein